MGGSALRKIKFLKKTESPSRIRDAHIHSLLAVVVVALVVTKPQTGQP